MASRTTAQREVQLAVNGGEGGGGGGGGSVVVWWCVSVPLRVISRRLGVYGFSEDFFSFLFFSFLFFFPLLAPPAPSPASTFLVSPSTIPQHHPRPQLFLYPPAPSPSTIPLRLAFSFFFLDSSIMERDLPQTLKLAKPNISLVNCKNSRRPCLTEGSWASTSLLSLGVFECWNWFWTRIDCRGVVSFRNGISSCLPPSIWLFIRIDVFQSDSILPSHPPANACCTYIALFFTPGLC